MANAARQLSWCRDQYKENPSSEKANAIMCISIAMLVDWYGCGRTWDSRSTFEAPKPVEGSELWTFVYNNHVYEISGQRFPEYAQYMGLLLGNDADPLNHRKPHKLDSALETRILGLAEEAQTLAATSSK